MTTKTPKTIAQAIEKFLTVHLDSKIAVKRSYDNWTFKQMWNDRRRRRLVRLQQLRLAELQKWGPDVAAGRFVIGYCRGQVRNERGNWIQRFRDLPQEHSKTFKVTAIQASKCGLLTEGIDNFVGLDYVESLDLSENVDLDDFACDQLGRQFRMSKTLREINLSYNPLVSVYGLEILFRIPSIRRILAMETQATNHEQIDLFVLSAEDERQCEVIVHKSGLRYKNPELLEFGVSTPLITS